MSKSRCLGLINEDIDLDMTGFDEPTLHGACTIVPVIMVIIIFIIEVLKFACGQ